MKPNTVNTKGNNQEEVNNKFDFVFGKKNYILMIIGIVVMGIGYLCLIGGGSEDPNIFNDAIYVKEQIIKKTDLKDSDFEINYIGPTIGVHAGPGTVAVFLMATNR